MLGQLAQEAAKQGSVTLIIPAAFLSAVSALLLYKGVPFLINVVRHKPRSANGNSACPKPGDADMCKDHDRDIASQKADQKNTDKALERIEGKVDDLPLRLVEIMRERK